MSGTRASLRSNGLLIATVCIALSAMPAWAGQFEVQDVYYDQVGSSFQDNTRVLVGARARYIGTMDDAGNQWNLWTGIRMLAGWTFNGASAGGAVVAPGQIVEISPAMGAYMDIPNCTPSGQGTLYTGKGVVSIYHGNIFLGMGGGPEIHEKQGASHRLTCTSPPENDGPDGGSPPAPGDGTEDGGYDNTPILIDLDRGNIKLTDLAGGVRFDLNRDGIAESLSWTVPGSGDAWLALDRNSNGVIDDGGELFGNYTDQPSSPSPHGYLALEVLDEDGDGFIGSTDSAYSDLLLWIDGNQDGTSSPSELTYLATAGVEWINLGYVESRSRDRHGNEFRYKSHVRTRRGMTKSVDIFLLTAP